MPNICWTCGKIYNDSKSLKAHFINEHEQFRDYIVCPTCGVVAYHLLIHYQAEHKGTQLPTDVPIVCTGPFNHFRISKIRQKKKTGRGKLKNGYFQSKKNNNEIHYRSSWEKTAYEILEKSFSVKSYTGEHLKIPYLFYGEQHIYKPDICIEFIDGTRAVVEIKPKSQCPKGFSDDDVQKMNQAKWDAARAYCHTHKFDFAVWTENALKLFSRKRGDSLNKNILLDIK